jgi:LmbE family N-acetylglucosaminyl deacetylase
LLAHCSIRCTNFFEIRAPDVAARDGETMITSASIYRSEGPVLFVGYHPDDIEFHASGTVAWLTRKNIEVIYLIATSGDGAGLADRREEEQRQSARIVGVKRVLFMRLKDAQLHREYFSGRLTQRFEQIIRELKPSIVVSFCPTNLTTVSWGAEHPDHRYGSLALWDAIYPAARLTRTRAWWQIWRKVLPPHKVKEVYWFGDPLREPYDENVLIDVTARWHQVEAAIRAHASQWSDNATHVIRKARQRAERVAAKHRSSGRLLEAFHRIKMP